jgi:poly(A) polymerase
MLTGPDAERALGLMHELGLMRVLLPEVEAMVGVEQPPEYHPEGDVFRHTKALFRFLEKPSPELALGCLLHDVGKPPTFERAADRIRFSRHARVGAEMADDICRRLRLSNESRDRVVALVADHMRFMEVENMRPATLKRFLRRPDIQDHLALHRADCLASHRKLDHWEFVRDRLAELGEEELSPPPLVTGYDLMELGWPRGPALGRELRRIEEMQLDGDLTTREQALERARRDLERGETESA